MYGIETIWLASGRKRATHAMNLDSNGRSLFIVDKSVSGWTGLRYLEEWTGISCAFDIATGLFEIGALLALDGKWHGLDKIRVLTGAETSSRTRRTLEKQVCSRIAGPEHRVRQTRQPLPQRRPSDSRCTTARPDRMPVYGRSPDGQPMTPVPECSAN